MAYEYGPVVSADKAMFTVVVSAWIHKNMLTCSNEDWYGVKKKKRVEKKIKMLILHTPGYNKSIYVSKLMVSNQNCYETEVCIHVFF
jgi:hypothetical protein